MDKGKYIIFTCITLSGGYLSLEKREAVDVIEKATFRPAAALISPAGECPAWFTGDQPAVIGPDPSPLLPHLDNWRGSDPDFPPGQQIYALPFARPMANWHTPQGMPSFLMQQGEELAFAGLTKFRCSA